jgi:ferrous iron transport protein B
MLMKKKFTIALAGNPNSGKTTIFNQLTGSHQHVGNYPGVTVEEKTGIIKADKMTINVIDLPGTYSLTASSPEELIARDIIINGKPDLVVNIVDSSNLERNLYLTLQLMELEVPVLSVFNMIDESRRRGMKFNVPRLEKLFGIRIVVTTGHKAEGIGKLKETIISMLDSGELPKPAKMNYGSTLKEAVAEIAEIIEQSGVDTGKRKPEWMALKILEGDEKIKKLLSGAPDSEKFSEKIRRIKENIQLREGSPGDVAVAERRYGCIAGACLETVSSTVESRREISDYIDMLLTNKILGIPIFFALMYMVFKLTFTAGAPLMKLIETFFGYLAELISLNWKTGSAEVIRSLLVDGIIGGVGGVLVFLPNIILLFLAIAIMEGTGYMARVAFIMDRLMSKIGLHGKSFIPMLIGFGCTVPAIMATRTLETHRGRMTTMLVAPLMSCGARLPIYTLIIPAFFPAAWQAEIMWIIYFTGIALAVICARILRSTLFKGGREEAFIMELPPYRVPTLKSVMLHMWQRSALYLKKAGTLILAASVILWCMTTFPEKKTFSHDYKAEKAEITHSRLSPEKKEIETAMVKNRLHSEKLAYTVAGRVGKFLEPVMKYIGFDWKISTALIGAFAAKEIFVSQLGIVYSIGETDEQSETLRGKLRENYTPLQGFCIMLFCLISVPCMATIAVTRRESNSWKWALFQLSGLTVLAYIVTFIVYQAGTLLHIGTNLI